MLTYDDVNLDKHAVSRTEVDYVLAGCTLEFNLRPSRNGNPRIMFIAFGSDARLLEIGVELLPGGAEHVFHADDATKFYRFLFERTIK